MSNTPKRGDGAYSLAAYKSKVKGEPFRLAVDEDNVIVIPRPTGDQILDAEAAQRETDSRAAFEALCGDVADEVLAVLGREDAAVLKMFVEDMQKHFGLGE